MPEERLLPEQRAERVIDGLLEEAGWVVQDMDSINLAAARGVAVRQFPTSTGPCDRMLFVDGKALGTVEDKKEGETLRGVEPQADRYNAGFEETVQSRPIPYHRLPLPFHYISTGAETLFTSRLDPIRRPREVFAFHRPETLLTWAEEEHSLRARLRQMPTVEKGSLHDHQLEAIEGLEESLREDRPRALVDMTMGSGKTFVAVDEAYRLLRFAGAKRLLFLVDRINLARQANREFKSYISPDDGRKFSELYNVQVLRSNRLDPAAHVVITTIQRLYSVLRGQSDAEFDPTLEEESVFELEAPGRERKVPPVSYQSAVPVEFFDFIFTDECHRSIYGKWGQVLDYFDAFITGLTATPSKFTYGYFNGNVVAEYTHEQSVADGINVDYTVYRIDTQIGQSGSTIAKGEWVKIRNTFNRKEAAEELEEEITYDKAKLDRAVVSPDQIRTVVRTFRDKVCTEIFPGRREVPKTVFFCKTDAHAEDVLEVIRQEFGRGSDFARKITYRTQGSSEQHIQDFRTDPAFRIAVSVDQISTGTDIKAIECLVFMRMVGERGLFEQMKGRGVRRMDKDEFWAVTPGAREEGAIKDHFVLVDCVGLTDEDRAWANTKPLDRTPSVPLKRLLQDLALGIRSEDLVTSVGARLVRLEGKLNRQDLEEFEQLAGVSMREAAKALIEATNSDAVRQTAARMAGEAEPRPEQLEAAQAEVLHRALEPLMRPEVRERVIQLQEHSQQIIDLASRDQLVFAGYVDHGQAAELTKNFEHWIVEHRDEYAALQAYYEQPYRRRLSYDDIKSLAHAIEKPPLNLTRRRLWEAYKKLDGSKVRGEGGRVLTDIVSLVRFALGADDELVPHVDVVRLRYDLWMAEQDQNDRKFTPEQTRWLEMVRDHIATSMTIEPDDFDLEPFNEEGGLNGAYAAFGDDLNPLLQELNATLGAA